MHEKPGAEIKIRLAQFIIYERMDAWPVFLGCIYQ